MALANPAALWLLLLIPLPLLLSRRKPNVRHAVANLYLWRGAVRQTEAQVAPRLLWTWLVLLQMACLGVVVLWLTQPAVFLAARRTAFVFDISASMAARDGGTTRLDAAREQARAIVAALPRASRVRVILAGGSARVVGEWPASDAHVFSTLDGLTPTAGSADVSGAIELARGTGDVDRIIVFTDTSSATIADDGSRAVQWVRVGSVTENTAVTRVAVQRTALGGRSGHAVVALRHYGSTPRDVDVEVSADGHIVTRQPVHLLPSTSRALHVELPEVREYVTARMLGGDALPIDDSWSVAVPPALAARVALIGPRGSFLERALTVNPSLSVGTYDRDASVSDILARDDADVLVCDGCNVPGPVGIPSLIVAGGGGDAVRDVVRIVDAAHPLAASLEPARQLATVRASASTDQCADVVLRVGDTSAVTACDGGGPRRVDIRLDLTEPGFVLTPAFPLLVANSLAWLVAKNAVPAEVTAGQPLAFTLPRAGSAVVNVVGPDGRPRDVLRASNRFVVGDTGMSGRYRIQVDGVAHPGAISVAINPDVAAESNLAEAHAVVPADSGRPDLALRTRAELEQGLAGLAAALLALEWWIAAGKSPRIDRRHLAWRASAVVLALLAAAGLRIPVGNAPVSVVVALDRSASIPVRAHDWALARLNAWRATMRPGDRMGLISFGADAALEWRPADAARQGVVHATVADASTDIGAALRLARAVLPDSGSRRIVLMSDGRAHRGQAERDALHAAAAGIPVDTVALDGEGSLLHIRRVSAPPTAAIREPYVLSIEIGGTPGARGPVVVYRDDRVIGRHDVTVGSDGTATVAITDQQDAPRSYVYRATIDAGDGTENARSAGTVVIVEGQPAILYVSVSAPTLRLPLASAGFRIIATEPDDVPTTARALSSVAGVILDDVPAERLSTAAIDVLTDYVERSGGGLLILGSARTLTLAGYPATALGRLLPIDLRPRTGQRAVPVELILLFDKSGSMADVVGGSSKIEIARQAVAEAVRLVPASDAVGVLAFDSKAETVAPLATHPDAVSMRTALEKIRPGGSTAIAPALETALQLFRAPERPVVARRHIILISDGRTSDADAQRLLALAGSGVAQISTVGIGSQANQQLLDTLARVSGGRAYFPENLRELPRMVAREAVRSSASGIVEEQFAPHAFRHAVLEGVDASALPSLHGYVVGAAKPSASVVLASNLDDPILCVWRAGLGRVAVFTADLGSPWSARLRSWPDGSRMWRQTVRWLSRRDADETLRLTLADAGGGPRLQVDAGGPEPSSLRFATVTATVQQPNGDAIDVALEPSAPGRYDAALPVSRTGPYVVALSAVAETSGTEHHIVRTVYWSADSETQTRGADRQALSRLASLTGGRLLAADESPFNQPRASGYIAIPTWLAAATLAMFILDLAWPSINGTARVARLFRQHLFPKRGAVHS